MKTYRQTLGGGGKLKAGTEATTRSILELFAAAIPCPEVFIAARRLAEWLAKRIAIR
jgi:hypothetical protein